MNITSIVQELRAESDRLERAIIAIVGIGSDGATAVKRTRPRLSAAARRRMSLAKKKWWMARKRAAKPRDAKVIALKSEARPNHGISAAGRKRLSEMMKRRWAERKKAKAASA